ncbi:hypothetical protein [Campylobacter ureolyticus]|uniref:NrdR family transcriptional regulator n=1 Tax=Campylobacter ureolyticus TaxID=827 RepID=UPI0022B2BD95|nr:hypothetical protein [Campylobacter ureolyticus]MCZ6135715.1 hypothetical protein [Campylobacter ureolyticus]MCZ6156933.1 hypothetical protein [Campylobacter ureolyticus]MCZ6168616.1 hypothetical protein [Campylobacter ureolyticus]
MICPKCLNEKTKVVATIKSFDVVRVRKCEKCGYIFHTTEKIKFEKDVKNENFKRK